MAGVSSSSATVVAPSYTLDGITQAMCTEVANARRLLGGMLAVWVAHDATAAAVVVRLAGSGRGGRLEHRRHAQQAAALQRFEVPQQRRVRPSIPKCFRYRTRSIAVIESLSVFHMTTSMMRTRPTHSCQSHSGCRHARRSSTGSGTSSTGPAGWWTACALR